MTHGTGVTQLK